MKHEPRAEPDHGAFHMVGDYDCAIVVQPVRRDVVASWLAPGLALGASPSANSDKHPVLVLFGHQQRVASNVSPRFPRIEYWESAVIVPFVTRERGPYRGPFLHTVTILLDRWSSTVGGDVLYAFPKKLARFDVSEGRYDAFDRDSGAALVRARIERSATPVGSDARSALEAMIQQPSVSYGPRRGFIGSGFWWDFANATIEDAAITCELGEGLMSGFAREVGRVEQRGTTRPFEGAALRLRTRWHLTPPRSIDSDWSSWNGGRS